MVMGDISGVERVLAVAVTLITALMIYVSNQVTCKPLFMLSCPRGVVVKVDCTMDVFWIHGPWFKRLHDLCQGDIRPGHPDIADILSNHVPQMSQCSRRRGSHDVVG